MGGGFWGRMFTGVATAALGAASGWAGYALLSPKNAGLGALPPEVAFLPFDRAFWAVALILLGAAFVLHALPHPPWARRLRSRS